MGAPPKGFDAETMPHASRIPGEGRARLPRVRVSWQDAAGEHDLRLEKSGLLGTSPSVSVRVDDPLVSRLHAELRVEADGVWIRDLASKNGTFVESVRVVEAQLPPGGRIRLGSTILRVVESWDDGAAREVWPEEQLGVLIGQSHVMRELFARIVRIAATTVPVLVLGETGVGKELVARTLHERSPQAAGPFVAVDCASLAREGLEELQGTAAATVFLDEVADLAPAAQAGLLRVLEARARPSRPPGIAESAPGLRFVAATQRDLPKLVGESAFREDLYFRLAVLPLTVPPLRERLDDLLPLVHAFLPPEEHAAVTPALLADLRARPWRGNVRELRNFVERALTLGTEEALELLPASETPHAVRGPLPKVSPDEPFKVVRDRWIVHLEREYLRGVLARTGGNVSAAAEAAGLDRAYVYRLIRKHGL